MAERLGGGFDYCRRVVAKKSKRSKYIT